MNKQQLESIDFYESRERFALSQLYLQKIKPHYEDHFNVELHFTSTFKDSLKSTAPYDAILFLRDKVTLDVVYKFIIEVKYRDSDYTDLLLEKKKYNALMKQYQIGLDYSYNNVNMSVLYINFVNNGAYIYNLTNEKINNYINDKKNVSKRKLVKSTFMGDNKEINKTIYYLPKELAKYYSVNISNDYYLLYKLKDTLTVKEEPKVKRTHSIF